MPPKIKITPSDIINAGVDIIRKSGENALNARTISAYLRCSTQPIFSNFSSMDELKKGVISAANDLYQQHQRREMNKDIYPPYKASGMAYIRFAKEEKELFKLLFMRDRSHETISGSSAELKELTGLVQKNTGLSEDDAFLFHLEMWVYVHGIATMLATSYLEWDDRIISRMVTDAYLGMRKQYAEKENPK